MAETKRPSLERVRALFDYEPETGVFTRKWHSNRWPAGSTAGSLNVHGYVTIGIDGEYYQGHHLAWFYVYGVWPPRLDHRDRDRANNSIDNLRPASSGQNGANSTLSVRNKSGFKGVSWHPLHKKWAAYVCKDRTNRFLGYFNTPEVAHAAYIAAAFDAHGEFACAG